MAREPLPRQRRAVTTSFEIGTDVSGYFIFGFYPDGRLGEVQARVSRVGDTIHGLLDAACILASICLQHGVPREKLADTLRHQSFPPSGSTDHPDIPVVRSVSDFLASLLDRTDELHNLFLLSSLVEEGA